MALNFKLRHYQDLARAGKVVYVGLSDCPAWRVAQAATIAELRGWAPVAGIQVEYSSSNAPPTVSSCRWPRRSASR